MNYIGKGIATLGVWVGCIILGALGLVIIIGPFVAIHYAAEATEAIWKRK